MLGKLLNVNKTNYIYSSQTIKILVLFIRRMMFLFSVIIALFSYCIFCILFLYRHFHVSVTNTPQEIVENFVFIKEFIDRINREFLIPHNFSPFFIGLEDMFKLSVLPVSKSEIISLIYCGLHFHFLDLDFPFFTFGLSILNFIRKKNKIGK